MYMNKFNVKDVFNTSNVIQRNLYGNDYFREFYNEMVDYFRKNNFPVEVEWNENPNFQHMFNFNNIIYVSDVFIKIHDPEICNITFLPNKKGIELYRLEMYNRDKGNGSNFMKAICRISQKTQIPVLLIPGEPGFRHVTDPKRLEKFYTRFGFKKLDRSQYWSNTYPNGKIRPFIESH